MPGNENEEENKIVKNVKCEECGKEFNRPGDLRRHVKRVHEGLKDHICKFCKKGFSRPGLLKGHILKFHEEESAVTFNCKFCTKVFNRAETLKNHIMNVHIQVRV